MSEQFPLAGTPAQAERDAITRVVIHLSDHTPRGHASASKLTRGLARRLSVSKAQADRYMRLAVIHGFIEGYGAEYRLTDKARTELAQARADLPAAVGTAAAVVEARERARAGEAG